MSRLYNLFAILALLSGGTLSAQMPNAELYLIKVQKKKDSLLAAKLFSISPQSGYNNQPSFSLDAKSLYFSSAPKGGITEVWLHEPGKNKNRLLGKRSISAYSPREVFAGELYVVCVEKDSTQRIHCLNTLNGGDEKVLEPDSVGYYSFLNRDTLVYYKLTEPHSLYVYALSQKKERWLCDRPARSFQALDRHRLLYALKDSSQTSILIYDFALHKAASYAQAPAGAENFQWHPLLGLLSSEASRILQWQEKEKRWKTLFELSPFGLKFISRFQLSPDTKHLALVQVLPDK